MDKSTLEYPSVAVIVLNYKNWQDTIECLESFQQVDYPNCAFIIVDNGSENESVEKILDWAEKKLKVVRLYAEVDGEVKFKDELRNSQDIECDDLVIKNSVCGSQNEKCIFSLIQVHKNLGFSGGNNIGIRYALQSGYEYIVLSNPDIIVMDSSILKVIISEMVANEEIWVAGPRIIGPDGLDQSPLREPNIFEELTFFTKRDYILRDLVNLGKPSLVPKIHGSFMVFKNDFFLKAGYLDDEQFLYSEEAIIAHRVNYFNKKICFVPSVRVLHKGRKIFSASLYKKFIRSRLLYHKKYLKTGFILRAILWILFNIALCFLFVRSLLRRGNMK
ncbi:MAG: glycosyltransferase family 2 protein [Nitrososphaeria archaeon]